MTAMLTMMLMIGVMMTSVPACLISVPTLRDPCELNMLGQQNLFQFFWYKQTMMDFIDAILPSQLAQWY